MVGVRWGVAEKGEGGMVGVAVFGGGLGGGDMAEVWGKG